MGRPKKVIDFEGQFYDIFDSFPLAEQRVILKVITRLVAQREREEHQTDKPSKKEPEQAELPGVNE